LNKTPDAASLAGEGIRPSDTPPNQLKQSRMKKQMVRISILQSSKILTALYVLLGFIYTLIGVPMIVFGNPGLRVMGIVYLFMPIIMGIFGFVFFVVFAAIYNFLARQLGGIEVEVRDVDQA
jgi:pilus assembly protein TadC